MSTVFQIYNSAAATWHDYSGAVTRSGIAWERNDLDSDSSGRTLDGIMHRTKIGDKRKLTFKLMPDRQSRYAQLDTDLQQPTFQIRYADLHGIQTRTVYCSAFKATLDEDVGDDPRWSGGAFSVIEV